MDLTSGTADMTINEATTYQTWEGFGGTFNEAGWVALMALDQAERDRAIRLLFSATEGANFALGRLPIGRATTASTATRSTTPLATTR